MNNYTPTRTTQKKTNKFLETYNLPRMNDEEKIWTDWSKEMEPLIFKQTPNKQKSRIKWLHC